MVNIQIKNTYTARMYAVLRTVKPRKQRDPGHSRRTSKVYLGVPLRSRWSRIPHDDEAEGGLNSVFPGSGHEALRTLNRHEFTRMTDC